MTSSETNWSNNSVRWDSESLSIAGVCVAVLDRVRVVMGM
jgi:hypothetical protein